MSQPILRQSTKVYTGKLTCLVKSRSYSSKSTNWFTRFLSPSEEKKLYLGITSAFREKLVEQSSKSAQTYSHIIEHAILSSPPSKAVTPKSGMLSIARIEQLKTDLDTAGKAKDLNKLKQLEEEMDNADLQTVTIYNRLIRAYLWAHAIDPARNILTKFEKRGLVPTTRSFTYLIQYYLKKDQLQDAKELVNQMQHLSLTKLRTGFDCSIMFKYYEACGDTHAIEFLWRDIALHIDTIKPGTGLFTQYVEYFLQKNNKKLIKQVTKEFLAQHYDQTLTPHQYAVWIKAVELLTEEYQKEAKQVLLHTIKNAPPKGSWDKSKRTIQQLLTVYLDKEQDLKATALYYRLRKMGVPSHIFGNEITQAVDTVVKRMEDTGFLEIIRALEKYKIVH